LSRQAAAEERDAVAALFEQALEWCATNADKRGRITVLLSRARFRLAIGSEDEALTDYRAAHEGEIGLEGESSWMVRDLRSAIGLAMSSEASPADRALEAARFYESLVRVASWKTEPVEVRIADLRNWATRSLASRDVMRVEAARTSLLGDAGAGLEEFEAEIAELAALLEKYGSQ